MLCFLSQVLLTFVFSLTDRLSASVLIFTICFAAAAYLYSHYIYLPYYNMFVNQIAVACASVFSWAAVCLVVAQMRDRPKVWQQFVR